MALDWGNELYYSKPIVRAYAVIPEILTVNFVDEEGTPTREFERVFDGTRPALDVVVSDNMGDVVTDTDGYLTVTYYGYTLNHPDQIYQSTVAPTDAGVYTAVATFIDEEGGRYGADAAVLVIKSQEASLTVEDQVVTYGDDYGLGITCTPDDCKYISIVAGIDAGGQISFEDLNPLSGSINIDFPERMDQILKPYMPEAYTVGISANELINSLGDMAELLEEYGFPTEAVNTIQSILDLIPETEMGEQKITFIDGVVPQNIGLYIVGGITCDPNYTFGADVGYLMVAPDSHNAELAFNYTDDNHIFTMNYIKNGDIDLGSHVVVGNGVTAEMAQAAEKQLVNIYLGIGTDGEITISNDPIVAHGAYTQIAYLEVNSLNQFYYAEPIIRGYLVVPETVKVQFVDESGAENPDRVFIHDGQPKVMDVKVTHNDGTDLSDNEALTVTYLGYDAKGIQIYNSTEAPTNIGAYTVIAVYADKEADLYGMAVGAMVIGQAEATVDVKEQHVTLEEALADDFNFGITVTPEGCEYISVVAGITTDSGSLGEAVSSVTTVLNIDFPESLDGYLRTYMPEAFTDGMTINEVIAALDVVPEKLAEKGLSEDVVQAIRDVLAQIPVTELGEQIVTFKGANEVLPTDVGVYLVGAITADLNYKTAYDTGYLIVGDLVDVDILEDAYEFTYDGTAKAADVEVKDLNGNPIAESDIADHLTITYTGYSLKNPTEVYSSTEAPVNAGVYVVSAVYADHEKGIFGADVSALVINAAKSTLTVEDQIVSGFKQYDLGIKVTPGTAEYISIVAGINVDGDQITDVVDTVAADINIDFPEAIDAVLEAQIPGAYANGVSIGQVMAKLTELTDTLAEYGLDAEVVDQIKAVLAEVGASVVGDQMITFKDGYVPTNLGAYAVAGIVCDANYIPSADIGYLLIGEEIDVTFVDGNGNAVETQTFVYNGQPQGMKAVASSDKGEVNYQYLTTTYIGYDAKGIEIYNSTTPPTNVGGYVVTAVYYDPDNGHVGMAVGAMAITQATTTIDYIDQIVPADTAYKLDVQKGAADCEYATIVVGIQAGGEEITDIPSASEAVVYIDLPETVDEILEKYAPGIYADGLTVDEFLDTLGAHITELSEYGLNYSVVKAIGDALTDMPVIGIGDMPISINGTLPTHMGAYAVAAVTCDINYTVAADAGYLLIGEAVDVNFLDKDGVVADKQYVVYNGQPQGMAGVQVSKDGTVLPGVEEHVTVLYLGYDADGVQIYASTTPPTNAGLYGAVALCYDSENGYVGYGLGELYVLPTSEVSIDVKSQTVPANTEYSHTVYTDPEGLNYITIVAGLNAGNSEVTDILGTVEGAVNIDFPSEIDNVLKYILPDAYANGTTVNKLLADLKSLVNTLSEFGFAQEEFDQVKNVLNQIPVTDLGDQLITLKDNYCPQDMGVYLVGGIVCEANYLPAMDVAYLLVGEEVDVNFLDATGAVNNEQILTFNGAEQSMAVQVTDAEGNVLPHDALTVAYLGFDVNDIVIYNSTTAPTNVGAYTELAIYYDAANGQVGIGAGLMAIKPMEASIEVADQIAKVGKVKDLGITVAPEDCKYISIVAGLNVGGDNITEVPDNLAGVVNVDFPTRIDEVLATYAPGIYANGTTVNKLIEKLAEVADELAEYGLDAATVAEIQAVIAQIPVTDLGDQLITFQDNYVPQAMGAYAVAAVTCDPNYTADADLGYLLVGDAVNVNYVDSTGAINNEQQFIYDGTAKSMTVQITDKRDNVIDYKETGLTTVYLGFDAHGIQIYASDEAPVNAGAYVQAAIYYDAEEGYIGIGVGALAITPADVTIDVADKIVRAGTTYTHDISTNPENCDYMTIVAGISAGGEYVTDLPSESELVVNIDFPESVEKLLREFAPEVYANGVTVRDVVNTLNGLADKFVEYGIAVDTVEQIQSVLGQIPVDAIGDLGATFEDGYAPKQTGVYVVAGVTCDANYKAAADLGYLVVGEAVDVDFVDAADNVNNAQFVTFNGEAQGMAGVQVVYGDEVIGNEDDVIVYYLGFDASGIQIYGSTTPPTNGGVYTTVAVYCNAEEGKAGVGLGVLTVLPTTEAGIDVMNQTVGVGDIYGLGITTTPAGTDYISIVAGLDAGNTTMDDILGKVESVVNIDFPAKVDAIIKAVLPEAYEEGVTANELLAKLETLVDELAQFGIAEEELAQVRDILSQIPRTEIGDQVVTLKDNYVPREMGAYAVGAILCDANYFPYADLGYLLVGETVDVQFVDGNSQTFVYNSEPQGMTIQVVNEDGEVLPMDSLSVTYLGFDAKGVQIYNSETAPTNVGAYTVIAVYYDAENGYVGLGTGAMAITQATPSVVVDNQTVPANREYEHAITVTPKDCEYVTIVAGLHASKGLFDLPTASQGVVNIDFPASVDAVLEKYVPEIYTKGTTVSDMLTTLSGAVTELADYGVSYSVIKTIEDVIAEIQAADIANMQMSFEDNYVPTEMGVYAVAAVTCDINYEVAGDIGYLLVGEAVEVQIPTQNYAFDGQPQDAEIKVISAVDGELDNAKALSVRYLGYDANDIVIYSSTEAPTNAGIYTVVAVYYDAKGGHVGLGTGLMTIAPADVTIDVANQTAAVGEVKDLGITVSNEDCKYISIVAGLNAGNSEVSDLLGTVEGAVNIDFPARVDEVLKDIIPEAYTAEGVSANEMLAKLAALVDDLAQYGIGTDVLAEVKATIEGMSGTELGDQKVTFADNYVPNTMGVYAVAAVTCDPNYEVAADFGYILVGEAVNVQIPNQTVTFDGNAHGLEVTVTDAAGNVLPTADVMTLTYLGFDANDIQIYNSTTAPTNAGVYTAIAVYYDAANGHVGLGTGMLTIKPAEASIDVAEQKVSVGSGYGLGITTDPADCKYISIVAGMGVDGSKVNVDFPTRIDNVLKEVAPGVYANGTTVDKLIEKLTDIVDELAAYGIDEATIAEIQAVIGQIPTAGIGDQLITFNDNYVPADMGVYAVAAVTCDPNYTVDADLGYLLVGDVVDVTFAGGNSQTVTYNGQPQGMDVEVRTAEGTVLTNADALSVTYLGYDAKGIEIYNSTEAPTNAGIYTVTAVYYDSASGHVGLAVGLLTILPADASIDVAEQTVSVGAEYDLGITVDPKDCGYVSIVAGLNAGGSEVTDFLGTVKGAVNVDFPERIDAVLYELIPEAYEGGMTVNAMIAKLQSLVDKLSEYGIDDSVVTEIQNAIGQIPVEGIGDQLITFTDGYVPTEMGVYAVAAVTCDANYKPAADLGYLLVGETVEVKISNQNFTYNGQPQGVDVQVVTADGKVLDNAKALTLTYLGYDANDIQIYNSTEAPTNAGIYTAVAVYYDAKAGQVGIGTGMMTIAPADASISVENQTAGVGEVTSLGITATPEDCKYISIVAGLDVSGSQITDVADKTTTIVNIDFPAKVDAVLKAYAPGIFETGTTVNDLIAELNGIVDRLAALGIDEATIAEIQSVIGQIPTEGIGDQLITFNDGFVPNTMGVYAVAAVTCDPNYEVAADLGYILIGEAVNVELGSQTFVYNGQPQGMSATVTTADGTVIGNTDEVTLIYLGYDAKGIEIYNSTTPPTNVGAYTAIALYYDSTAGYVGLGTGMMAITPADASIDVESQAASVGSDYEIKVTVTPADVAYTTIVAGINVKGNDITDIANTATGVVNIDFPAEIDSILQKYVPEIYNEGTTVNGLIAKLNDMVTVLADYGVSASFVTEIQNAIAQIPASDLGDQLITFKNGFVPKEMGVYAVAAVTSDVNYQVTGDVGFLLVGDTVEVQFLDAAGNVTDYTSFPYNGQPQGLTTKVVTSNGTELNNANALLVNYVGFDAKGIEFYNSTNAPVNAGLYVQSAIYFDAATGYVGAGVGTFTIGQGAATIDVANQNVTLDSSYDLGITVTPENCDYISIVAGVKVEGDSLVDLVGSVAGTVNVDFPESIDAIFEELMPEEYANGMTINEMIEKLGQIPEELKEVGVPANITDEIQNVINQIPVTDLGNMLVTFTDGYVPSEMGIYAVGAVTCDVNYAVAADIGYLVVGQSVDIKFIDDNGNENASVVYTYDGQPHGLKVKVTAADGTDLTDSDKLTYTYLGGDAGGLGIYNSTEPPKNAGVYTVAAMYYDEVTGQMGIGIGIVAIEPRPLSIKIHDAEKLVGGIDPAYTYEVVSGLVPGDTLTLAFEREAGEAPGEYAIKTSLYDFARNMNYSITAEEGTLTIKERDIVITLDDITTTYGKEPVITYDIDYTNALVPDTLRDIIVLYDISYGDATDIGTYDITAKATFVDGKNPVVDMNYADIYNLTVVGGKLTIEAKSISDATVMGHNDVIYNGSAQTFDNLVVIDGKTVLTEGVDYTVEYRSNVNVGEAVIVITGMGNYFGEKTATFNITEADNEWSKQLSIQGWTYGEYDPAVNSPSAESVASGTNVSYEYFADKDCTKTLMEAIGQAVPTVTTPVGTYYVRATAFDTDADNFKPLVSEAVAFTVTPKSIAGADVTVANDNLAYNGKEQNPSSVLVAVDGKVLTAGTDYYVTYANNVDAGEAVITITGMGNYIDVATGTYVIAKADLADAIIAGLDAQPQTYDGTAKTPVPTVQLGGVTIETSNYDVTYGNNVNAGTATVTVTAAADSNYTGSVTANFTIGQATNRWTDQLTMTGWEYGKYNAQDNAPDAAALFGEVTYSFYKDAAMTNSFTPSAETDAGTYYVKAEVAATANYSGIVGTKTFTVGKAYLPVPTLEYTTVVFDGTAKTPAAVLEGVDPAYFTVSYTDNTEVGTAVVTVSAANAGNYYGSHTLVFAITPMDITGADVTVDDLADLVYTGKALTHADNAFDVKVNGKELVFGTDYTVSYTNNVNVGTATAEIKLTGNYEGTVLKEFNILPAALPGAALEYDSVVFDGTAKQPKVMINGLTEGVDFVVTYPADSVNVGSYTVVITAADGSNYTGTIEKTFRITQGNVANASVTAADLVYTGKAVKHDTSDAGQFRVVMNGIVLDPQTDYIVSYANNTAAGINTATVTIIGTGNYTGSITANFSICAAQNEWTEEISISADTWEYGTAPKRPTAAAKFGDVSYEYFTDPACEFSVPAPDRNAAAGTYYVRAVVEATDAYTGLVGEPIEFTITAKSLEGATVRVLETKVYDGWEQYVDGSNIIVRLGTKTLEEGLDYFVDRHENNVNASDEAKVVIIGTGNYEGEVIGTFTIEQADNSWYEDVQIGDWTYGDEPCEPWADAAFGNETITFKYFTDKACRNEVDGVPTEAGTYYVKAYVEETTNYAGLETTTRNAAEFNIQPGWFDSIEMEYFEVGYDGTAKTPEITVTGVNGTTLVEGTDYEVTYTDNVEAGIASVVITGKGNYEGEWSEQFIIMPIEINDADVSGIEDKVYTGKPVEQDITIVVDGVTLTPGDDYVIEYVGDNVEVGTVYMYVYGNGNYACNLLKVFQILPADLTDAALSYTTVEEDGDAKTPSVVVKGIEGTTLTEGEDYYVTYADNVKPGTATVTVNGMGNYAGSQIVKTFTITAKVVIPPVEPEYALTDAVLEYTATVYDGTAKTPSVIVKDGNKVLEADTDYIVSYKDNVNAGTATVTIKGIGNYKGELIQKTFQIGKADNAWTKELAIAGWAYGEYNAILNAPSATAKVGTPVYEYFKVLVGGDGTIETVALDKVPTEVGLYIVKATVAESANYKALTSSLVDFNISPKSLADDNVKVTGLEDKTYTGKPQTLEGLKVTVGGKELVVGTDITVSYENNVNAGTATVTIEAATGSGYTESITATFDIEAAALPSATLEYTEVEADGTAKTPSVTIEGLKEGTDFTVTYLENVEPGRAVVTVTGMGNYEGTQVLTFEITAKEEVPPTMYTVTFDTLGGSAVDPMTAEEGTEIVLPEAPVKDGAEFLGWALTADAKEAQYQPGDKMAVTADITVYAVWDADDVTQIYGKGRYQTALGIAENLKAEMGVDKFNTIIVATGENFADALSGSYLSHVKNAPILLINGGSAAEVTAYINANLVSGGKVYVLGGDAAVKESWISGIKSSNIERLKGKTRYETNIEILKEAGVTSGELLVATGEVFADSLSAASAKRPIFLVKGDSLSAAQKEFLGGLRGDSYTIIGGAAAVSYAMEDQIAKYGNIDRVKGKTRYQTSIAVAESFVSNPEAIVVAYGENFPDGLCGGLLAIVSGSPVILSSNGNAEGTASYIEKHGITEGYVLGGNACFTDESIAKMFGIETSDIVKFRYPDAVK